MKKFLPPILLVLLSILSLAPFTFGGESIYFGNIADLYVPFRTYAAMVLSEGRLPLWTPFLYSGYPFLADPQSSVFYPTTVLFMFLNPVRAILSETVIALCIAGVGMYLLLRLLRVSVLASFLGAMVFSGSGFFTSHIQHTPLLSAAVWLPLLLAASLLAWERRGLLYALLGGIVLSLVFFAGHPQYAYYFSLLVVIECLVRLFSSFRNSNGRGCVRAIGIACVILLVAAGIAAIQILPTAEFSLLSERQEGLGLEEVQLFGWTFAHFMRLLSPYAFLGPGGADVWWRTDLSETTGYVGIITLVLAGVGAAKGERRGRLWGLSFLLPGTLLALSPTLPFTDVLYELIPGFSFFRVPGRFLLFQTFGICILAAGGVEVLSALFRKHSIRNVWMPILGAFLFTDLLIFRLGFIPPVTPPPALLQRFPLPSSHVTGVSRLLTQKLASNFALLQGVENVNGYTPLTVQRYTEVVAPLLGGNIPDSSMLRFLNIDMALRPEEFPSYGTKELRDSFPERNPNVLPRATIVHRYVLEEDLQKSPREYLHSRAFDPGEEVILSGTPSPLPEVLREADPASRAVMRRHVPTQILLDAELARPGILVLSEVSYPGWVARMDGQVRPILTANEAFRAVSLPAGSHTVEFTYDPLSFRVGRAITVVTLVVIGGVLLCMLYKRVNLKS